MAGRDHFAGGGSTLGPPQPGSSATNVTTTAASGGLTSGPQSTLARNAAGGVTNTTADQYGAVNRAGGPQNQQQQRTSRRDQLGRPELGNTADRSPSRPGGAYPGSGLNAGGTAVRGSPAGPGGAAGRGGTGRGRGGTRSYNNSPSGNYPDDYRHVPTSISTSAFTVGGVGAGGVGGGYRDSSHDPTMMDRSMGDPRMDRGMDRSGMDRGMDRGMDHHRSSSMPGGGPVHGRSRSASRGMPGNRGPGYHSLDREGYGDRDFMPLREPRERSLDRDFGAPPGSYGAGVGPYGRRERSLDRRDPMLDPEDPLLYGGNRDMGLRDPMLGGPTGMRGTRLSPNPPPGTLGRDPYFNELQHTNSELQRDLSNLKKELELTNQKLGSSMHSIKTFWSPELKKERALRKEESAKYSLINDQLKLLNSENQVGQTSISDRISVTRNDYSL